jgi:hypothetical protein
MPVTATGRIDLGSEMTGQLQGEVTNAAGTAVDQHFLTMGNPGP